MSHRSVDFVSWVKHFFRFWLWLVTGVGTKQWVAVHRKHHKTSDTEADPHTPIFVYRRIKESHPRHSLLVWFFTWVTFLGGVWKYQKEASNPKTLEEYGKNTPDDAVEKFYRKTGNHAWMLGLLSLVLIFGSYAGCIMLLYQVFAQPWRAAGIINGLGHMSGVFKWGYRNYNDTDDFSLNIPLSIPFSRKRIGLFIGGEELHNNHHGSLASPKFSHKEDEIDIGWSWLNVLAIFRLAWVTEQGQTAMKKLGFTVPERLLQSSKQD